MSNLTSKDWFGFNVEGLPDDILNSLYRILLNERDRRRSFRIKDARDRVKLKNRVHSIKSPHRRKELAPLLEEDWSDLYPPKESERIYYVYAHVTPNQKAGKLDVPPFKFNGIPFYIGKGCGDRAYDLKRNEGHGQEIRRILSTGARPEEIVQIVKDGMTESEAFCLEAKLIYFFGTRFDGKNNGVLVNLTKPPTPFY